MTRGCARQNPAISSGTSVRARPVGAATRSVPVSDASVDATARAASSAALATSSAPAAHDGVVGIAVGAVDPASSAAGSEADTIYYGDTSSEEPTPAVAAVVCGAVGYGGSADPPGSQRIS